MAGERQDAARVTGVTDAEVEAAFRHFREDAEWPLSRSAMRETLERFALAHPPAAEREAPDFDLEATQSEAHGEGMDHAADFIFTELAKALGLASFTPQDGSEEWKGDVRATLMHILYDAKVLDQETGEREAPGGVVVPEGWAFDADSAGFVHIEAPDGRGLAIGYASDGSPEASQMLRDLAIAMLAAAPPPPAPIGAEGTGEVAVLRQIVDLHENAIMDDDDPLAACLEQARTLLATPAEGQGNG